MKISDPERLESLIQAWSATEDPVECIRQALNRTDNHPALALWAYRDEQVRSLLASHRKIAGWVDVLRRVVPAETWKREWVRLLDRLPVVLRMWVFRVWFSRWPPESDFWAGCLNNATVLQWLIQWSQQDPAWRSWAVERAPFIRSDRMRRKILPASEIPSPTVKAEPLAWQAAPTIYYFTPMNGHYYWLIRYTAASTDTWAFLGLRTQADRRVLDAVLLSLDIKDRNRIFGTSQPSYRSVSAYWVLQYPTFFGVDLGSIAQGGLRRRTVRRESASPFIVQALERTPRDFWPFYLRTYATAFVDPWFRWDTTSELRQVQDLLTASVLSATGAAWLPFSHPKEATSFLNHLFNVLWGYHPPEERTCLIDWLDGVTRDLKRPPALERLIARFRGSVFAPVPPRLTPEVRQALAKTYFLVRNRPLDETVAAGMKTLLAWTLRDLVHWVRSLAQATAPPPEPDIEDLDAP